METGLKYRAAADVVLDAAQELMQPMRGISLPWWPKFTSSIRGLRAHELTLLCAPTGAGKTTFCANISAQLCEQQVPHFVAPVEGGDTDFIKQVMTALVREEIRHGHHDGGAFPPEYVSRIVDKCADTLMNSGLQVSTEDNRIDREEIINMLSWQHQEHGAKVAILDNLNFFLAITDSTRERAEMDEAIHAFVMQVKKLPIHTILIVHPRKTENGQVTSEFDIKGSSTAVQECQNVLLFNRPTQKQIDDDFADSLDRVAVFRKIRKVGLNVGIPIWFSYVNGRYQELTR